MRVLLALDLSPESESLVAHAVAWCRRLGGVLQLRSVSALLGEAQAVGSIEVPVLTDIDARRAWEKARLKELAATVPAEIRGGIGVVDGVPVQVISELSAAADLVILGTHGRTGLRRFFLGSVAEAVIRTAACPVLVLPLGDELAQGSTPTLREELTVCCPVDVEEVDLRAARWVRDRLGDHARFELVHALRHAPWIERDLGRPARVEDHPDARHAKAALDDLAAVHELGLSRSHLTLARTDNPGEILADHARELRADLIALPTHGRTGLSRLFLGSVAARVLRRARTAVLVVPRGRPGP